MSVPPDENRAFKLINTDDDAATCTEAEFQGFCESISQFLSHLGAAMGADEPEEGADKQVARTESKIMLLFPSFRLISELHTNDLSSDSLFFHSAYRGVFCHRNSIFPP